ncbi:hypothetical protein [Veronia pacifica]|uniref:Uncharacterized protein n=1 Tax=Veronia pacifica TaxID=1080227 RepID=A0A1C3EMS3_9GAMM|nr:hypothetical protein [Veronia pacifica]ODA34536.1 hypothetical protein A8L45_06085 [Veronia pacifica]
MTISAISRSNQTYRREVTESVQTTQTKTTRKCHVKRGGQSTKAVGDQRNQVRTQQVKAQVPEKNQSFLGGIFNKFGGAVKDVAKMAWQKLEPVAKDITQTGTRTIAGALGLDKVYDSVRNFWSTPNQFNAGNTLLEGGQAALPLAADLIGGNDQQKKDKVNKVGQGFLDFGNTLNDVFSNRKTDGFFGKAKEFVSGIPILGGILNFFLG